MGEVRLRLAATHSTHPSFPPPLPKLPIPIKKRLKIAEEGKEGRKAKEHDCSVFHPSPPSLHPQPNQIKQEASETEEECLLIFVRAASPPAPSPPFIFCSPLLKMMILSMFLSHISCSVECLNTAEAKRLCCSQHLIIYHYLKLNQWEITHQLDIRCKMAMTSPFIVIKGCHMK